MELNPTRVSRMVGGIELTLETGQVARQAHGAVVAKMGETVVLATVVTAGARPEIDFFPLTVDYREMTQSAGKIPGGFFKREGRPTTKEILTMRVTDRSIRPLFPDGFKQEVQVMSRVLGYDGVHNSDVLAMIASFAALHISKVPFHGALGAVRVGHLDGKLCLWPTDERRRTESRLDLLMSGHADGICMVESAADQLPEDEMLDALELGQSAISEILELTNELREKVGVEKMEFSAPERDTQLDGAIAAYRDRTFEALKTIGKHNRYAAVGEIKKEVVAALTAGITDAAELAARTKAVKGAYSDMSNQCERDMILGGTRTDGRAHDEIRGINIAPDFIERQHGCVLFTRGETQAIVGTTLGTPDDETIIDGIEDEYKKAFYLHYAFPPYSVGEAKRLMGPGRREIGHGMLAERSLAPVIPPHEKFPYTIRIVSEITESNGSSSMATVCGGTLSMMLAGVPLAQPVAGIAMGLIQEGDQIAILSDIQGSEDHNGDMDFKVSGSGIGLTALQMDIKVKGVTRNLLERALSQAAEGRKHILRKMLDVVSSPASDLSEHAPRMEQIKIPSEKIGYLIGPGGRNIREMQQSFGVRITIVDDNGNVQVFGTNLKKVKACVDAIQASCETPKIGTRYTGTVKAVKDFGAFIEILPGVEGMCHISELAEGFVERVSDVVEAGQEIEVVVINVDDRGKIKLSHKQLLAEAGN